MSGLVGSEIPTPPSQALKKKALRGKKNPKAQGVGPGSPVGFWKTNWNRHGYKRVPRWPGGVGVSLCRLMQSFPSLRRIDWSASGHGKVCA